MTSPTTPEQLAAACEESAQAWANEIDTRVKAAAMLRTLSAELAQARAELEGLKAQGQWLPIAKVPDGDVWFALDCGHVVMGFKQGDLFDWEASIDHDCCHDAGCTKAMPCTPPPAPPTGEV